MAERKSGIIKAVLSASFLLTLIIILLFLYWNATALYKQEAILWQSIIGGYLITLSLVLVVGLVVSPETIKQLAKANYWKSFFLRFVPSAIVTLLILILVTKLIKGQGSINPLSAITYVPLHILMTHLFVISQVEEIMNGVIYNSVKRKNGDRVANLITIPIFALFHFAKTGGSFVVMLIYVPLRYWWNYLKENGWPILNKMPVTSKFFKSTPHTQQSNAGSHFGWNTFILGFIKPFS